MRIFLQIDPPESLNPNGDSTIALAIEAQARGHEVFYYTPQDLSSDRGEIVAHARAITFYGEGGAPTEQGEPRSVGFGEDSPTHEVQKIYHSPLEEELQRASVAQADAVRGHYIAGSAQRISLETTADVILIRQDPPYDMAYLTTTWLLQMLRRPKVLNAPRALRERPEKLFPLHFPQFCPPTLISGHLDELRAFQREMGAVVLKPLYGHGGHGVLKIPASGENLEAMLEMMLQHSPEPVILQQFLPDVTQEEKRILLINGEFAGAFGRLPAAQEIRSNLRVGGQIVLTTLTKRQQEICEAIAPFCRSEGIMLAGLDVIGDWLTEINITSPTGLRAVEKLYGQYPAKQFWDAVEAQI